MDQIVNVGRRKRAVARVFFKPGTGTFIVNNKEMSDFFPLKTLQMKIMEPFDTLSQTSGEYDIHVNVNGGGITGQAEAIRLGISRSLVELNEEFKSPLKKAGMMTRDARKVERKKYGKKKARKSSQFSKR